MYTRNKATYLELTFDQQTMIAENDYLYVYDSEDNEIGKYTGAELAGQTVHIDGNTIKIKLVSNSDDGAWGFKVTDIKSDGIIYGDLNDDGEINSTDITMARRYYKGNLELTPGQLECLDLNLDGEINSTDITILRRYYKGAISEIPIGR